MTASEDLLEELSKACRAREHECLYERAQELIIRYQECAWIDEKLLSRLATYLINVEKEANLSNYERARQVLRLVQERIAEE